MNGYYHQHGASTHQTLSGIIWQLQITQMKQNNKEPHKYYLQVARKKKNNTNTTRTTLQHKQHNTTNIKPNHTTGEVHAPTTQLPQQGKHHNKDVLTLHKLDGQNTLKLSPSCCDKLAINPNRTNTTTTTRTAI